MLWFALWRESRISSRIKVSKQKIQPFKMKRMHFRPLSKWNKISWECRQKIYLWKMSTACKLHLNGGHLKNTSTYLAPPTFPCYLSRSALATFCFTVRTAHLEALVLVIVILFSGWDHSNIRCICLERFTRFWGNSGQAVSFVWSKNVKSMSHKSNLITSNQAPSGHGRQSQ